MNINKSQGCTFFQFNLFDSRSGLTHGVFSRLGGVSQPPWDSLNLGGTVGDAPANVQENLNRLVSSVRFSVEQLVQVRQIHSAKVIRADRPMDAEQTGDAIITDRPGLLLLMRFADCVPILFYDPENQAAGIAHAGWKGTLLDVAGETVREMAANFGTRPANLLVGIGPSIGPDHYQIGQEVIQHVKDVYQDRTDQVLVENGDGVKLDLWQANYINLIDAGVTTVEMARICTGCNLDHWYSHRAEKGQTGRFAAVIGLQQDSKL